MALWWIGNVVLLVVVAPAVVWLAHGVYRHTVRIAELTERIRAGGGDVARDLEELPKLLVTRDLAATARQRVGRYGAALERVL